MVPRHGSTSTCMQGGAVPTLPLRRQLQAASAYLRAGSTRAHCDAGLWRSATTGAPMARGQ
eukprot:7617811-Alexandrium_andersonii.AAC.1